MRSGVAGPIVLRERAANDIFVDLDAEGMNELLSDAYTAKLGIAPLHLDDSRDEFGGRTFGTGFSAMPGSGKEEAVFPIVFRMARRCWRWIGYAAVKLILRIVSLQRRNTRSVLLAEERAASRELPTIGIA